MRKVKLINWLCLSGLSSLLFYILHTTMGAMSYPGYDWKSQAVSDLTAVSAPSFLVASRLVTVHHLFACLSCVLVCIVIQDKANSILRRGVYLYALMNWISAIGYTLFPLTDTGYTGTLQEFIHVYVVTLLVVLLSLVSIVLIIIGGFKDNKRYRSLAIWGMLTLVLMLLGPIGTSMAPPCLLRYNRTI